MDDLAYVPASPEARSFVIDLLTTLKGDGGRSDEDDAKFGEVINELTCLNEQN